MVHCPGPSNTIPLMLDASRCRPANGAGTSFAVAACLGCVAVIQFIEGPVAQTRFMG
jgi:hypothetical protein